MNELVSLVDLPPTLLLDAAGISVPKEMQGNSVLPLVRRESAVWPQEVLIQIGEEELGRAIRTNRWKYGVSAPQKDVLQEPSSTRYEESYLYDLQADPSELTNLIGMDSFEQVTVELRERLKLRIAESGEEVPHIEPAAAKASGQRRTEVRRKG
jgi:arylsulfatase A-like enzyme